MGEFGHFIVQTSYAVNACIGLTFVIGAFNYHRVFGLLFLFAAFIQYQFELIYTQALFYQPFFFLSYVPPILWFGPLLYLIFQRLVFHTTFSKVDIIRHFTLPFISTLALIPLFIKSSDLKLELIHTLYYSSTTIEYLFLSILCVVSVMLYTSLVFNALPTIKRMLTKTNGSLFTFLIVAIIFSVGSFTGILTHSLRLLFLGNIIFSCLLMTCYLLHLRFDMFFPELLDDIRISNDHQSHLTTVNINKVLANLNYVIHEEKIYRNPDITLMSLANRLKLSAHQLSELLNHEVGKKFNSFILDFRIQDAIEALKYDSNATISSIAASVGFKSNSAFYLAFKKVTGKSPRDYRNE